VKQASRLVGLSRPVIYDLIKRGDGLRSFLFKTHPEQLAGVRLLHWPTMQQYMLRRCESANEKPQAVLRPTGKGLRKRVVQAV
jgi:predicted DNA-binding transcriptional regulator AlpA